MNTMTEDHALYSDLLRPKTEVEILREKNRVLTEALQKWVDIFGTQVRQPSDWKEAYNQSIEALKQ